MRVALVSESFLPVVNGVSNTVRQVAEHLTAAGHQAVVIAPGPGPDRHRGVPVVRTWSVPMPGYRSFPVGLPDPRVEAALEAFDPDVVHLASPFVLGHTGLRAAERLGLPTVAVYQTDVSGFAEQYGLRAERAVDRWVARLHRRCDRTLVPSRAAYSQLDALGVPDLHLWRRGVNLALFDPSRRDRDLRARWRSSSAGSGHEVVVGYVGRLAPEKQVRRLTELASLPGVRLVVVGDGPERPWLERHLPGAVFTGTLGGTELAQAFASLDVFVHTGENETFCQTVQEAQASGVAVVAPGAGGPLDLVEHGRTGLLYDVEDRASLRRRVALLVNDHALRADLAEQGRRAVAGRSWSRLVDELVDVHYAEVTGTVPTRRAA